MNYTGYTIGSNSDYSPAQEMLSYPDQLGGTYIPDNYTTSPGFSLESFFDQAAFPSADVSTIFPKEQGQYATFPSSGASTTNDMAGNRISSHSTSRHPSDAAPLEEQPTPPRPQRKRGRPRLDRNETISSTSSPKGPKTGRLPHNQVERKYREGLNAELERLRKAVPTLTQSDEAGAMGQPKPSKAMVLASAIEYIQKLEAERDALKLDNERLRQSVETGQTIRTWETEDDSLQDYLTDA
ncbi:hypothetical protein B5807_04775 [Epicoccum nigrum]|uniref:BHLH domain-containing protein n=1 Tax=Epicoccum nigrum TaxID=105696 RepID=A0A1Y2M2Y9_EPING|nr:hypothetical protein B5807_04775 [Epicoccum nigrum]